MIVKHVTFAYVNHTWIHSGNQPILSVKFLAQGKNGSLWLDSSSWLTDYDADAIPTVPLRHLEIVIVIRFWMVCQFNSF